MQYKCQERIPFNVPCYTGNEEKYIHQAIADRKICGDGSFTKLCSEWLEKNLKSEKALLTTSCTHAIEMAAILADIREGDEVIMPSFTFVSTADAFVLRGARIVFVDIRPDTMNLDETLIEDAVTKRTKVVVPVHYAGVSCEMEPVMEIAGRHRLMVVEDAAQAIGSTYKGQACGTIGTFGCLSFHETKNLSMGEGGALLIRDADYIERAEIIREKGTNRTRFYRGGIDRYTWIEAGSSYLPSELNAAYLWAQLEKSDHIQKCRMDLWKYYYKSLKFLKTGGYIKLPEIPGTCTHNAHMFYIRVKDQSERDLLIAYLKERGIHSVFHYIPLHTSPGGKKYGVFHGVDRYTTKESGCLLRLPLYYGLTQEDQERVCQGVEDFYKGRPEHVYNTAGGSGENLGKGNQ